MATRKIKDAKDLDTNELIYFKGHAQATFMSNGWTVEDAVNQKMFAGYPKVELENNTTELNLQPYTYYSLDDPTLGSYNISLENSSDTLSNEWIIEITLYDDYVFSASFPEEIKWANDIIPDFLMGYTYIICITNNIACFVKCEN